MAPGRADVKVFLIFAILDAAVVCRFGEPRMTFGGGGGENPTIAVIATLLRRLYGSWAEATPPSSWWLSATATVNHYAHALYPTLPSRPANQQAIGHVNSNTFDITPHYCSRMLVHVLAEYELTTPYRFPPISLQCSTMYPLRAL